MDKYLKELEELIEDINMTELKSHIEDYDLGSFVRAWQSAARTAIRKLRGESNEG